MSRQKKNRNDNSKLQKLLIVTAILNLIKALIDLINKFIG